MLELNPSDYQNCPLGRIICIQMVSSGFHLSIQLLINWSKQLTMFLIKHSSPTKSNISMCLKTCWGFCRCPRQQQGLMDPCNRRPGKRQCHSLRAGLQCYKLPSLFSPVETSDHMVSFYISDGFFSFVALCWNGTAAHENTHGRLFEDISQSQSPRPFLGHFPISETLENQSGFSVLHAKEVLIILENML